VRSLFVITIYYCTNTAMEASALHLWRERSTIFGVQGRVYEENMGQKGPGAYLMARHKCNHVIMADCLLRLILASSGLEESSVR
jgi:hypothetical protein